jgi:pimeloyl-ACP methyl ester carboxylesterase
MNIHSMPQASQGVTPRFAGAEIFVQPRYTPDLKTGTWKPPELPHPYELVFRLSPSGGLGESSILIDQCTMGFGRIDRTTEAEKKVAQLVQTFLQQKEQAPFAKNPTAFREELQTVLKLMSYKASRIAKFLNMHRPEEEARLNYFKPLLLEKLQKDPERTQICNSPQPGGNMIEIAYPLTEEQALTFSPIRQEQAEAEAKASTVKTLTTASGKTIQVRCFSPLEETTAFPPRHVALVIPGLGPSPECETPMATETVRTNDVTYGLDRSYVNNNKFYLAPGQNLDEEIETASAWLAQKHHQAIQLVGFSMGGLMAMHAATQNLKNVDRIYAISPAIQDKLHTILAGVIFSIGFPIRLGQSLFGKKPEESVPIVRFSFLKKTLEMANDIRKNASKITVPTFVLTGDKMLPCSLPDLKQIVGAIPQGKLFVIPGASHNLEQEQWESLIGDKVTGIATENNHSA